MTPLMIQYLEMKRKAKDDILLFRLGDFYEAFFDDAVDLSKRLGITLTKRGVYQGEPIPMCGVPWHSIEPHLVKLLEQNCCISLCEQIEQSSTDQKGILKRDIIRRVTPGTIFEENLLSTQNNFIVSFCTFNERVALIYFDLSENKSYYEDISLESLSSRLTLLSPKEIIGDIIINGPWNFIESKISSENFEQAKDYAFAHLKDYIFSTVGNVKISEPSFKCGDHLIVGLSTWKSLEIFETINEGKSLFDVIDYTVTRMGKRLLRDTLANPLTNLTEIQKIHLALKKYEANPVLSVRSILSEIPDLSRIMGRITLNKYKAKDIFAFLIASYEIEKLGFNFSKDFCILREFLINAFDRDKINEDVGYIRVGFDEELDKIRETKINWDEFLSNLQKKTGIPFKLRDHRQFGVVFEISQKFFEEAKKFDFLIHKQTLLNAIRYTTIEAQNLNKIEGESLEKGIEKEKFILNNLVANFLEFKSEIESSITHCAKIDFCQSNLYLLNHKNWSLPNIDNSNSFEVLNGRHPVVESYSNFVPNDCNLEDKVMFITGPNMGGKSTYLRQNALILLLAHCGLPVCANFAHIGLTDRLYSRIGASDSLSQGKSTFFLEMEESAEILKNATHRSFVIVDEIGRGTSVLEGSALAQAVYLELLKRNTRTLFSTHYSMDAKYIKNAKKFEAHIDNEKLVFDHKIKNGLSNNSYAFLVALKAGVPTHVIEAAKDIYNLNP